MSDEKSVGWIVNWFAQVDADDVIKALFVGLNLSLINLSNSQRMFIEEVLVKEELIVKAAANTGETG